MVEWKEGDQVATLYAATQYDNGVAAGAPPVLPSRSKGKAPGGESAGGVVMLPRFGGGPILIDATPRAPDPNAPSGGGITSYAPKVPETAPVAPVASQPILRASTAVPAATPTPVLMDAGATARLDWRLVALATLAAFAFFVIFREDK